VVRNLEVIEELSELSVGMSSDQHPASTQSEYGYRHMFIGLESGSVRIFKQYMKGKAYPYRPEQWPDVVLKGMDRRGWRTLEFCGYCAGKQGSIVWKVFPDQTLPFRFPTLRRPRTR
jgi:hypothetical protein